MNELASHMRADARGDDEARGPLQRPERIGRRVAGQSDVPERRRRLYNVIGFPATRGAAVIEGDDLTGWCGCFEHGGNAPHRGLELNLGYRRAKARCRVR